MKTWTVGEVLRVLPRGSYTAPRLRHLWNGRKRVTLLEVLTELPFSDAHRVRLAMSPGALPVEVRQEWADIIVHRAILRTLEGPESLENGAWKVWAMGWLNGMDRSARGARAVEKLASKEMMGMRGDLAARKVWNAREAAADAARRLFLRSYWMAAFCGALCARRLDGAAGLAEEFRRQVEELAHVGLGVFNLGADA